jgi:hypothetical protein
MMGRKYNVNNCEVAVYYPLPFYYMCFESLDMGESATCTTGSDIDMTSFIAMHSMIHCGQCVLAERRSW